MGACTSKMSVTSEEVAKHSTDSDCWVIVGDDVYDVTKFLGDHPGGKKASCCSPARTPRKSSTCSTIVKLSRSTGSARAPSSTRANSKSEMASRGLQAVSFCNLGARAGLRSYVRFQHRSGLSDD